jgi:hypothetical protein
MKAVTLLTASIAGILAQGAQSAGAPDYSAIQNDMEVLRGTLEAAAAPTEKTGKRRHHDGLDIDALYLARQGMLFDVEVQGDAFRFDFEWHDGLLPALAPLPDLPSPPTPAPAPDAPDGEDFEFEIADEDGLRQEIEVIVDETLAVAGDGVQILRMHSRGDDKAMKETEALRSELRQSAKAYRQAQQQWRKAANDKAVSEKEKQKLKEAADKSRTSFDQARKKFETKMQAVRAEAEKERLARIDSIETRLLDALCQYAGGTRRLAAGEQVSLILRDAGDGGEKDRIWIIGKKELDQCVSTIQDSGFLKKTALHYES